MTSPPSPKGIVLPGGFVLRSAVHADLRATARAHVWLLPVGLFPSMGARFVRRWHRTFLRGAYGRALVVVDPAAPGSGVVGFLLGTIDQAAHTDAMLADRRSLLELASAGALAMLRRPRLAVQFIRTRGRAWARRLLRRRASSPARPGVDRLPSVAVLSAIAVQPDVRGHGIGAHLVEHFLSEAQAGPAAVAELVTDAGPDGVAAFYERLGWRAVGDRVTRDGTTVRTFRYALRDAPAEPVADDGTTDGDRR